MDDPADSSSRVSCSSLRLTTICRNTRMDRPSSISRAPASARAFFEFQQVPLPQQALPEGATPLCEQFGDVLGGCCTCPVALQFGYIVPGCNRACPRLHH